MKGYSQQLQFIHDCGPFIISFNFSCLDFNVSLKLYTVIKSRAKWKIAQLANFPLLCRNNLLFVATAVTCRGTSYPKAATSGCNIRLLRTLLSCRNKFLLSALTKSRHQLLL